MLKSFPNEEVCQLSPLNMCATQKWYIYDLLDIINYCTKFQLNWIRKSNFQLKLSDTAVNLKYNQGHRKCYAWVMLSKYDHAKFDIYHVYGVYIVFSKANFFLSNTIRNVE